MNRRTKIVVTFGPASDRADTLCQLIAVGVDTLRLNFSHGDPWTTVTVLSLFGQRPCARGATLPCWEICRGQKFGSVKLPMGV
ncbi:pyruvate kinase [Microbulbifer sp. 2205BS26-8]|uniref:pyruvate kinase n=1 Tax=Microbulbifer sp. 2205BS26-8 TaxID=3064386 RepID=UPI0035307799